MPEAWTVHGGLPAYRSVHLRRQRRRYLNHRQAAHVGCGQEPGEISHGPTTQRHDHIVAVRLLDRQLSVQRVQALECLRLLALRYREQDRSQIAGTKRLGGVAEGEVAQAVLQVEAF